MDRSLTFQQFFRLCNDECDKNTHLRRGQVMFRVLDEYNQDMANKILGTELDPFYKNERILPFLNWVEDNWNK